MEEKVSIIVPVYNCEKYVEECLKSIINQTYKNIEIIIINDGSTDNSQKIIEQCKDERTIVINKENEGVSVARNLGLEKATSEWIMFVDSDDTLEENAVESFVKNINSNVDIIISNVYVVKNNERNVAKCTYTGKKEELIDSIFYDNEKWKLRYAPTPFAKLYRKKFLEEKQIKFIKNIKYGEDGIFNLLAFYYAGEIAFVEELTYNYRIHSESVMKKYDPNLIENYTKLLMEYKKVLTQNNLYNQYKNAYNYFILRQVNKFYNRYFFIKDTKKSYEELKEEFNKMLETEPYKNAIYNEKVKYIATKRKMILFLTKKKQFKLLKTFYKFKRG